MHPNYIAGGIRDLTSPIIYAKALVWTYVLGQDCLTLSLRETTSTQHRGDGRSIYDREVVWTCRQ